MFGARANRATRVVSAAGIQAVVADPARHRLLTVISDGENVRVRAYTPGERRLSKASGRLPFNSGSAELTVVQSSIWATGYTSGHGRVLVRLDPTTLNPITSIPVASRFGSDAMLTGSGHADFWLRGLRGMWCTSTIGQPAQHWPYYPDAVSSRANQAYAAIGDQIARLKLNDACKG